MSWRSGVLAALAASSIITLIGVEGCERENRDFGHTPPATAAPLVRVSTLQPGPVLINDSSAGPYDGNAYGMSEGKQLFDRMNCVGCHAHGGGAQGPPLMDETWIYGSDPSQIFATIVQGRPNGMPSFRGKLTNDQVWQLVAYVRSMSGLGRRDVRGGRDDAMYGRSSEQNTKTKPPRNNAPSSASEMP
jgi:cytochrome c oxidase cbb3-type subunit 3